MPNLPRIPSLPLVLVALSLGLARPAAAQSFRLHGTAAGAHAVGGYQQRELGWGGTGRLGLEWVWWRELGLVLQGSGTFLEAGKLPLNTTLQPLDAATSVEVGLGLHLRPFARKTWGRHASPAGLWLGGSGGYAFTGGARRPMVDAALGFDFLFRGSRFGLGPMVGIEHVFQPNTELRTADANVLFVGIHGVLEVGLKDSELDGDRDDDGIRDSRDRCPDNAEDKDGFEDLDGCPDKDNDQDGVLDGGDGCPLVAEDKDLFQDDDGCPEADNDKDGLLDPQDKCPNEAEDKDGFEDDDGCPDKDNDQDGIPDKEDLCPDEPETKNGYADHDGCPDAEQIRVVGDKIVLDDRVHFMVNSHIIRQISYPLLNRLAKLVIEHPEYIHIEVLGHTDERGPDWFNEKLSQSRANSVLELLVKAGVARGRLTAKGYGSSRPLVEKKSEYAWYMNRRVEFEITRELRKADEPRRTDGVSGATETDKLPPVVQEPAAKPEPKKPQKAKAKAKPKGDPDGPPPEEGPEEGPNDPPGWQEHESSSKSKVTP